MSTYLSTCLSPLYHPTCPMFVTTMSSYLSTVCHNCVTSFVQCLSLPCHFTCFSQLCHQTCPPVCHFYVTYPSTITAKSPYLSNVFHYGVTSSVHCLSLSCHLPVHLFVTTTSPYLSTVCHYDITFPVNRFFYVVTISVHCLSLPYHLPVHLFAASRAAAVTCFCFSKTSGSLSLYLSSSPCSRSTWLRATVRLDITADLSSYKGFIHVSVYVYV